MFQSTQLQIRYVVNTKVENVVGAKSVMELFICTPSPVALVQSLGQFFNTSRNKILCSPLGLCKPQIRVNRLGYRRCLDDSCREQYIFWTNLLHYPTMSLLYHRPLFALIYIIYER